MLSGETAGGNFPIEAVTIMRRIVEEAEHNLDYLSLYINTRTTVLNSLGGGALPADEAMASSASKSAFDMGAPLIVCFCGTGTTVRLIAKYRPNATILGCTGSEEVAKGLLCLRGVISMVDANMGDDPMVIARRAIEFATRVGVDGMTKGAKVILLAEQREGEDGSGVNAKMLKVLTI